MAHYICDWAYKSANKKILQDIIDGEEIIFHYNDLKLLIDKIEEKGGNSAPELFGISVKKVNLKPVGGGTQETLYYLSAVSRAKGQLGYHKSYDDTPQEPAKNLIVFSCPPLRDNNGLGEKIELDKKYSYPK